MSDEIRSPWIKKALLAHNDQPDPERQPLQIISVDKQGRPDCLSDKKHYIRSIFEDEPVLAMLDKYQGAPSLKGAVILPLNFTFQQDMETGEFVLHVITFRVLGSIGANVFGDPVDVRQDQEIIETFKCLQDPIEGAKDKQFSESQNEPEEQLFREQYIARVSNLLSQISDPKLVQQGRIFTQEVSGDFTQPSQDLDQCIAEMELESQQPDQDEPGGGIQEDVLSFYGGSSQQSQPKKPKAPEAAGGSKQRKTRSQARLHVQRLRRSQAERQNQTDPHSIDSSQLPMSYSPDDVNEDEEEEDIGIKEKSEGREISQETKSSSSMNVPESQSLPHTHQSSGVSETPPARRKRRAGKKQKVAAFPEPPAERLPTLTQLSQFVSVEGDEDEDEDEDADDQPEDKEGTQNQSDGKHTQETLDGQGDGQLKQEKDEESEEDADEADMEVARQETKERVEVIVEEKEWRRSKRITRASATAKRQTRTKTATGIEKVVKKIKPKVEAIMTRRKSNEREARSKSSAVEETAEDIKKIEKWLRPGKVVLVKTLKDKYWPALRYPLASIDDHWRARKPKKTKETFIVRIFGMKGTFHWVAKWKIKPFENVEKYTTKANEKAMREAHNFVIGRPDSQYRSWPRPVQDPDESLDDDLESLEKSGEEEEEEDERGEEKDEGEDSERNNTKKRRHDKSREILLALKKRRTILVSKARKYLRRLCEKEAQDLKAAEETTPYLIGQNLLPLD